MIKHNWDKLYNSYLRNYGKEQIKAANIGVPMGNKFSEYQFKAAYSTLEMDRIKQYERGERGKTLNVMRDLVQKQKHYKYSNLQAKKLYESVFAGKKEKDFVTAMIEIRTGRFDKTERGIQFWEAVKAYKNRDYNIASELSERELEPDETVGQVFFGSS